ncbi:MAG: hypothetical protein ACKPGB_11840, partial [Dolichospermum sp.]
LLGKGRTQNQAVEKLVNISQKDDQWNYLVAILASCPRNIEVKNDISGEDREMRRFKSEKTGRTAFNSSAVW